MDYELIQYFLYDVTNTGRELDSVYVICQYAKVLGLKHTALQTAVGNMLIDMCLFSISGRNCAYSTLGP